MVEVRPSDINPSFVKGVGGWRGRDLWVILSLSLSTLESFP